ncbi:MAG: VCBS repeat-containing protein [Bacteroidetes bacterium]|nr:VCBS repeat-containing protein [Bacteroidota bacterium]
MVAYTNTNFTGVLSVNPVTGVVTITDAKQAGTYTVTVKAFNNFGSDTSNFTLTVTNPICSQAKFTSGTNNTFYDTNPYDMAVGDFNDDGKQDLAVANYYSNTVTNHIGNGSGGYNGYTTVSVGNNPSSIEVGEFNGDGKQDVATTNFSSNTVSIRLGDGSGGFSGSLS